LTEINYSKGINRLLRKRLDSENLRQASTAAYLMAKHGSEANKKPIQARLNRWLKEWSGRAAQLEAEETETKIILLAMFQINLIEALIQAKSWKLSSAEIERLKQTCLTERCRRHFRLR
jgi:ATP-dependent Clp protease ATP-binding subunit ClpA